MSSYRNSNIPSQSNQVSLTSQKQIASPLELLNMEYNKACQDSFKSVLKIHITRQDGTKLLQKNSKNTLESTPRGRNIQKRSWNSPEAGNVDQEQETYQKENLENRPGYSRENTPMKEKKYLNKMNHQHTSYQTPSKEIVLENNKKHEDVIARRNNSFSYNNSSVSFYEIIASNRYKQPSNLGAGFQKYMDEAQKEYILTKRIQKNSQSGTNKKGPVRIPKSLKSKKEC